MASISSFINKIRTAIYGKDVRSSIADGIEAINDEVESTTIRQGNLENKQDILKTQFDEEIKNLTLEDPSSAELVAARTTPKGLTFSTIGNRFDSLEDYLNYMPINGGDFDGNDDTHISIDGGTY